MTSQKSQSTFQIHDVKDLQCTTGPIQNPTLSKDHSPRIRKRQGSLLSFRRDRFERAATLSNCCRTRHHSVRASKIRQTPAHCGCSSGPLRNQLHRRTAWTLQQSEKILLNVSRQIDDIQALKTPGVGPRFRPSAGGVWFPHSPMSGRREV